MTTALEGQSPLRKLRDARGLSQIEVAEIVGIHQSTYAKIETGYNGASPEAAEKIVKFFGSAITEEHVLYPSRFPDYQILPA